MKWILIQLLVILSILIIISSSDALEVYLNDGEDYCNCYCDSGNFLDNPNKNEPDHY